MPNSYDYFKKQVYQMGNIKAETAHELHILGLWAVCAKKIVDAMIVNNSYVWKNAGRKWKVKPLAFAEKGLVVDVIINFKDR